METIWTILGLEPTKDISAIKRAYARQAPKYHPEEDPEGFLRLREAYQAALAWAENGGEDAAPEQEPEAGEEDGGWQLRSQEQEADPFRDCEAVRQLQALYSGNRRKDPKAWMDYFTSVPFLDVMREPGFTAAVRETVEAGEAPPTREFVTWLSIAYQFTMEDVRDEDGRQGRQFRFMQGAAFEGVDAICQAAAGAPMPKRFQGNELAMFISFFEYGRLQALAAGGWSDEAIQEANGISDRYVTAYLQDKCVKREWNDVERHPAGLRLLEHFFRRSDLPEELYRHLWTRLDLKSALFGRSKVLYQDLRALVLERVPDIENEEPENFLQLNKAHDAYLFQVRQHPEQEEEATAAFFAREDFQKALRSRRFVEEQLLRYGFWLSLDCPGTFLRALEGYCREHPDTPCVRQIGERIGQSFRDREIQKANLEDKEAPVGSLTFDNRPFLRHWLNTGFYGARHPDRGATLAEYLDKNLPFFTAWSGRFYAELAPAARTASADIWGRQVEAIYHLRYIEFQVDGQPVHMACLPWERLTELEGEDFFHFLPMTAGFYDQFEDVQAELLRRLEATAAPKADIPFLAACLADHVCHLPAMEDPDDDPLASFPLEIFAEDADRLYGASWYEREGVLILFEQSAAGRRDMGQYRDLFDGDTALAMAQRLLEEAVSPAAFHLSLLKELPYEVYASPHYATEWLFVREEDLEAELADEEEYQYHKGAKPLTEKTLEDLLKLFGEKKVRRLELHWDWNDGTLVLLSDRAGYACLFFEENRDTWYSMLSQPEIYRTVDHTQIKYVPFGLGKLPEYSIHQDPGSILRNLDLVFAQIGRGRPEARVGDRWLWSSNTELHDAHHKFLMAKQKLGGFPQERGRNYVLAKFVLKEYPVRLESEGLDGARTLADIRSGSFGLVTNALVQFMQGKLSHLRLTWRSKAEAGEALRHIVLLQDNGRFMMAWLADDKRQAEFYVSDVQAYMDVEGKKYPKDTFLGRTVGAYLVHTDLKRIRNCLDLLLDDIADPAPVVNQFAQFAWETPVKRRSYEEIRQELVREDE